MRVTQNAINIAKSRILYIVGNQTYTMFWNTKDIWIDIQYL